MRIFLFLASELLETGLEGLFEGPWIYVSGFIGRSP